ncbi:MAG: hypothetical protein AAF657_10760 [Acidobacteriota bacterium]
MSDCNVPITFPVKATILDSDLPPFDRGGKLVMRQGANGRIRVRLRGSGVKFGDGDLRGPIGDLPAKIVVVFNFEGEDHHLVITRIRCGDKVRDCGVVVKIGDDRGVGSWVSEEDT